MKKDLPTIQKALKYEEHGDPAEVLAVVDIAVPQPGLGEVLVEMQACPIHPSDMGLIQGSYGRPRNPPAVAGREGVGTVVKVGEGGDTQTSTALLARALPTKALCDYLHSPHY